MTALVDLDTWLQYYPRAFAIIGLIVLEALSIVALIELYRAISSVRGTLANKSPWPPKLSVDLVVTAAAASTALALAFCLHIPLWSLLFALALLLVLEVSQGFQDLPSFAFGLETPGKIAGLVILAGVIDVVHWGMTTTGCVKVLGSPEFWNWMAGRLLFSLRSMDLASGVSPLIPLILVGIGAISIILCPIHRIHLLGGRNSKASYLNFDHVASFKGIVDQTEKIDGLLRDRASDLPYALAFLVAGSIVFLWLAYLYAERSIEGTCFGVLLLLGAFVVYIGISRALLRFVLAWDAIRGLLHRLYWHPSRQAYEKFHELLPGGQAISLSSNIPNFAALEISVERAREIRRIGKAMWSLPFPRMTNGLENEIERAEKALWESLPRQTGNHLLPDEGSRLDAEKHVSEITCRLSQLLERKWRFLADPTSAKSVDKEIAEDGRIICRRPRS